MTNNTQYEKCPVCGKKGWYLVPCTPDSGLAHYNLHNCKYCGSAELLSIKSGRAEKYLKSQRVSTPAPLPEQEPA